MALTSTPDINFTVKAGLNTSSTDVVDWTDQEGGEILSVPTERNAPQVGESQLNSNDVIHIDGSLDEILSTDGSTFDRRPSAETGQTRITYMVIKIPSDEDGIILDCESSSRRGAISQDNGEIQGDNVGDIVGTDGISISNEWAVIAVQHAIRGYANPKVYINGVLEAEDTEELLTCSAGNGFFLGDRSDEVDPSSFDIVQIVEWVDVQEHSLSDVQQNTEELQNEWGLLDDESPTLPTDDSLSTDNVMHDGFDVTFDESTDNESAQENLTYTLYTSLSDNLNTDASTVEANGDEQDSATGVGTLTATGLDAGVLYYYNVVVEDEAENKSIYTSNSQRTNAVGGNVTLSDSGVENADVAIFTVDDTDLGNLTLVETVQTDANGDYEITSYDPLEHYFVAVLHFEEDYSGTASGGTSSTLEDNTDPFTADEFDNEQSIIRLTGGTGSGQTRIITANTESEITVKYDWDTTPDGTTEYEIGRLYSAPSNFHPSTE